MSRGRCPRPACRASSRSANSRPSATECRGNRRSPVRRSAEILAADAFPTAEEPPSARRAVGCGATPTRRARAHVRRLRPVCRAPSPAFGRRTSSRRPSARRACRPPAATFESSPPPPDRTAVVARVPRTIAAHRLDAPSRRTRSTRASRGSQAPIASCQRMLVERRQALVGAERLNDHFARRPRAVQFDQKDALPRAEQQFALRNGHAFARAEQYLLAVRVAVGTLVVVHMHGADAEVVVAVVRLCRRTALKELAQVFEQQRLVFLDTDRGGGVARKDICHAVTYPRDAHELGHLIRDIEELDGLVSLENQPSEL